MFKWISQIRTQNNNNCVPLSERGYGETEGIFNIKKEILSHFVTAPFNKGAQKDYSI
jgi:hypothetical protein